MPEQIYYLQNPGNQNGFATLAGKAQVGTRIMGVGFSGTPNQQWIAAAYPGTDLTNSEGVVFVLYYAGTAGTSNLVLTAGACGEPVTLQTFKLYEFSQLWTYAGPNLLPMSLATGCVLEMKPVAWGPPSVETDSRGPNKSQLWTLVKAEEAEQAAREADEQAAVG